MKILYLVHQFYPEYYTGTEKFVYNTAFMMQKFGNKVKVITYSFYNDTFYDRNFEDILFKQFTYKGIPVLAFKLQKPPFDLHFGLNNENIIKFAENLIETEKPDVIHIGHPMRVHEFVTSAVKLKIPYILTLTDFFLMCPNAILKASNGDLCAGPQKGIQCNKLCTEFPENYIKDRLEKAEFMVANAKGIFSPSKFLASMFKNEFSEVEVNVINHGLRYDNIKTNNKIYRKNDKNIIFCYAGSLNPHKGVHIILDAFTKIKNEFIKLKIYGSGEERYVNRLKDIANGDNRIEFCGVFKEENIGDVFNSLDVIIVPSIWYENYPLVLHEALACNVPTIVSNLGGMAEKIKDGFNGFTFDTGDYKSLGDKIKLIIDNPEILNEIKENIKKNVVIPTVEQEAYKYLKVYESLR